jgi:1-acyl-sn-glycerol-3-phosphate acyltransferase
MVTYQLNVAWLPPSLAGLVIGALFVLPFVLFSATSGQLADKFEKARMMRVVKNIEIVTMALAAYGFVQQQPAVLLVCVFLMGLHSTLFGPVKYAYLPQVLNEQELTGGNGMVEMGTFVSILLGNLVGGLLIAIEQVGPEVVAITCLAVAVVGRLCAQAVPLNGQSQPQLALNWNPMTETRHNLRLARQHLAVFRSILGISWMWFFGAVFLTQFPSFAKEVLHADAQVASLLLVTFSLGVAIGSLLCERLSRGHVEIGLVPLGALGMTVFSVDLYVAASGLPPTPLQDVATFLRQHAHFRVLADLFMLALSAGLYSVPMYALIQLRSPSTHCARIIATNNILNALFMVCSAVIAGAMLAANFSVIEIFLWVGIANAVVTSYVFALVPEYVLRFLAWVLTRLVYRFRVHGAHAIATQGATVLIANHVSYVDAVLMTAASPRPIVFLMDYRIFDMPVLGWLFKWVNAIPVATHDEDEAIYHRAMQKAQEVLAAGDVLAIFPEGSITRDGQVHAFKPGVIKILEQAQQANVPVRVVPAALINVWGSFFSRIEPAGAMTKPFRRGWFNRVALNIGPSLAASDCTLPLLHDRVTQLLNDSQVLTAHS